MMNRVECPLCADTLVVERSAYLVSRLMLVCHTCQTLVGVQDYATAEEAAAEHTRHYRLHWPALVRCAADSVRHRTSRAVAYMPPIYRSRERKLLQ